jgi:curved DNA-binding protein CbpA
MSEETKKTTDLYSLLELNEDFTDEELENNYKKLRKTYHPDKGGDSKKFIELKIAYKVLSDPERRKKYKSSLAKTFQELKSDYSVPLAYEKLTEDNEILFKDKSKKMNDKWNEKTTNLVDESINVSVALKDLIKNRDSEIFNQNQSSEFFSKKFDSNTFNFLFNKYRSTESKGITLVEEVNANTNCNYGSIDLYDKQNDVPLFEINDNINSNLINGSSTCPTIDWIDQHVDVNVINGRSDESMIKVLNDRMKEFNSERIKMLKDPVFEKVPIDVRGININFMDD